jgi:hypothetical protein
VADEADACGFGGGDVIARQRVALVRVERAGDHEGDVVAGGEDRAGRM